MKLYADFRSGSCRRVLAVIEHLMLDVEIVETDIFAGKTHTPEFLKLNPNGMLPVLTDGDMILWEASPIMIHLCETYGETLLWPRGPGRLDVLRWMFWAAEHFRQPAPVYFEEIVVAKLIGKPVDEARLKEAKRKFAHFTPVLEGHLIGRNFVCTDGPTLADIDLAVALSQMSRSGIPYKDFPEIMKWQERLNDAMPGWAKWGGILNTRMDAALTRSS